MNGKLNARHKMKDPRHPEYEGGGGGRVARIRDPRHSGGKTMRLRRNKKRSTRRR